MLVDTSPAVAGGQASGWQPMETAPADGEVLLYTEEWGGVVAFLNRNWGKGAPFWDAGFDTPTLTPTYWHPMPPRPSLARNQGA